MKTYEYKGKKYQRVKSECKCLGCDFSEDGDCIAPMPSKLGADCMERINGRLRNYQFKEIKPTVAKLSTDEIREVLIDCLNWIDKSTYWKEDNDIPTEFIFVSLELDSQE